MSEYTDSQGLDDDIRMAIIGQIQLLLHEHHEKVALKHHLRKELETLNEPPEKRHTLQKYHYDEMIREARERPDELQISEEETQTVEPDIMHHAKSTPETQENGNKKMTAAERRLEHIKEDIKKIDEDILKRREQHEEGDNMLERSIDKRQRDIIDLDVRFLLQIMDEPSIEKLGETRDGLSERVHEIGQDIRVLRECLLHQKSADKDTETRNRAIVP